MTRKAFFFFFCTPIFFTVVCFSRPASGERFDEIFQPSWAADHLLYDGEVVQLKLDNFTGTGFGSKSKYLFGKATAEIKLAPGDSAGTVTAFYMSSDGPNHHEFDFEFLGNSSGEPILVQTNVYVNGVGNREQRVGLWFDPTADFHSYGILWNRQQVVKKKTKSWERELAFPDDQPMGIYSSIWNADDWATQGGRVKIDWSHAPFVTTYRGFWVDACECPAGTGAGAGEEDMKRCAGQGNEQGRRYWWQEPMMEELSLHQSHQLLWVRNHHLVYDYCADSARFPAAPPECEP
ncbi:unnamed protein product [Spirodela intermedia]|uniref:Xyloglucan endotransglucosylase/hydrolase n=1 Tax=Spirodela intermedia TaxID=51605 RepID=A0A7I8KA48_SPIIN|nr:unnamed protein product [Spirodela intermedia]